MIVSMVPTKKLNVDNRNKPEIFLGKDVLELLSSSVYINPLTVYREYIQNATDAIDEAVELGLFSSVDEGIIKINLDYANRRVVIRDNGCGLANKDFSERMVTFGASQKRGTDARGYRGVGRLSSLGYVQQLVFRSRANGDSKVLEAKWDGHVIRKMMIPNDLDIDLNKVVQEALTVKNIDPDGYPEHFFEVELIKPRRIANDKLLNEAEIEAYICQVCPCPFAPTFSYGNKITEALATHGKAGKYYKIIINGNQNPVYRPYQDCIEYSDLRKAKLTKLKIFEIDGIDGNIAAVVWFIHHEYMGAIPSSLGVKGLRARIGNIQIGDDRLFIEIFPEDRFCSWTIGEVHVLDGRAVPNSRRDEFEINIHLENIIGNLRPLGLEIARKCRLSSQKRNREKLFKQAYNKIKEKLDIIVQGAVSEDRANALKSEINIHLNEMYKTLDFDHFSEEDLSWFRNQLTTIQNAIKICISNSKENFFNSFPTEKRANYKEIIDLIYECSTNRVVAKNLVDRILNRLGENQNTNTN